MAATVRSEMQAHPTVATVAQVATQAPQEKVALVVRAHRAALTDQPVTQSPPAATAATAVAVSHPLPMELLVATAATAEVAVR
jgi:hypothetical protein